MRQAQKVAMMKQTSPTAKGTTGPSGNSKPPMAGPTTVAVWMMELVQAVAVAYSSSGTVAATSACPAGLEKDRAAPMQMTTP